MQREIEGLVEQFEARTLTRRQQPPETHLARRDT